MTREEAIKVITDYLNKDTAISPYNRRFINALNMAIEALQAEPVKHGEWVASRVEGSSSWYVECSKCHVVMPPVNYTYCPNCGAKMDKD